MQIRKAIILTVISILLMTIAACGNSGADIPISRLEFGMSEEQVKSVVKADVAAEYSDSAFPVYAGTIDIDEDLRDCMFVFGSGGLYEIFISSDEMTQEECFALRDKLIRKLSELYGVSEEDWEIENNGYANFYNYINENGRLMQLYVRLYDIEDSSSLMLIFRSGAHSFSIFDDEEYINSIEKIPVIPKN